VFRDDKRKPIASICVNFDMTDIMNFNGVIQEIFRISEEEHPQALETFQVDTVSTLNRIADETIRKTGKALRSMERKDKIEIVGKLEDEGFFLIKGAIKLIAAKLKKGEGKSC
jgi:predicted transcriptional regulator YheO